jgi:uncharacterized protein
MGINDRMLSKTLYRMITGAALTVAAAGVVVPLLPTTPFLLVAAWSASRHSPAFEAKLLAHPTFGPPIRTWRAERALCRRTKAAALTALAVSLVVTLLVLDSLTLQLLAGFAIACVAAYLGTRPTPRGGAGG